MVNPTTGKDLSRRMKYPYTFSAKIALFPYAYYFKHNWFFRWYLVGIAATCPIFLWINKKANSPANVAAFAKKKEEEAAAHHH